MLVCAIGREVAIAPETSADAVEKALDEALMMIRLNGVSSLSLSGEGQAYQYTSLRLAVEATVQRLSERTLLRCRQLAALEEGDVSVGDIEMWWANDRTAFVSELHEWDLLRIELQPADDAASTTQRQRAEAMKVRLVRLLCDACSPQYNLRSGLAVLD